MPGKSLAEPLARRFIPHSLTDTHSCLSVGSYRLTKYQRHPTFLEKCSVSYFPLAYDARAGSHTSGA